jgi:hypothetical protein
MVTLIPSRIAFRRLGFLLLAIVIAVGSVPLFSKPAQAATMQTKTGYYVGNSKSITVSGLGFRPDMVIIKQATSGNVGFLKTSAMPANTTAHFSSLAVSTGTLVTLNSDGFTISSAISGGNVIYRWTAVGGSDCTSSGSFCVGTYNGNGSSAQNVNTGFQPSAVINKRSTSVAMTFRTASMPTNYGDYFISTTAASTDGSLYTTFNQTGFTAGTSNAASGGVYYFAAFGQSAQMKEGSFTGDGADDRNITGLGFLPGTVIAKNSNSTTANNRRTMYITSNHYGDISSYIAESITDTTNIIQALQTDGFQVGSGIVNEASTITYWFAFGVEPPIPNGTGSFNYREGAYSGTGAAQTIANLPFSPDVVIIKSDGATSTVLRTSLMGGDYTTFLGSANSSFSGGITSLQSDGFSIGTAAAVNTSGTTYRWQAFGNAYNPLTQTGAGDFAIGAYLGNTGDDRTITGIPFTPDLVYIRGGGTGVGALRPSAYSGDKSSFFSGTIDSSNVIQSLNNGGFQLGSHASVNSSFVYWWVAFKAGPNLRIGTYTGTGLSNRLIPAESYRSNYTWVKRSDSSNSVISRPTSITDDSSQYFSATANRTDGITSLNGGGFTVAAGMNLLNSVYYYFSWRQPLPQTLGSSMVAPDGSTIVSPAIEFSPYTTRFTCSSSSGVLGTSAQRLRISNLRSSAGWTASIAATNGQSSVWQSGNGKTYDYNDITNAGCSDGADNDTVGGALRVDATNITVTPETFCSGTNISPGQNQTFQEGTISSITIANAASGADTGCYWDITGVNMFQDIPLEQLPDTYQLPLTITTVAS